ncbi:MAG: hypothetical protein HGA45_36575 [Chloroflexales bacterium]|nr:hypothetical protein [Chloroflexales bacterium]
MAVRLRILQVAALAALILTAAISARAGAYPAAAEAQASAARIYVLRGGDPESDNAVIQALIDRGFAVTSGVVTPAFDGSQVALADYDVLVVLYNANWAQPVPPDGLNAIRDYVTGGGGLVTGEWFGWRGQLSEIMPSQNCGWNTAAETTYTQVMPSPTISVSLPISFTFPMASFTGSESCLEPRPEATVFYSSSNGGGKGTHAGLAAWNVGEGRVAAFSTLLSAVELANEQYRILFQNTVTWVATVRDASPPAVKSVGLTSAGGLVRDPLVELTVTASDRGGAGIGSFHVAEYVFSGNPEDAWRLVRTSGWQRYRPPGASLSWTLSDTPGVHYLRVYAADRAGNISREPGVAFVSYEPAAPVALGLDEIHIYRVEPASWPQASVRMRSAAGNPDLYVFGPGVSFAPESDGDVEQTSFTPAAGVYQIEVVGYQAGAYTLDYSAEPLPALDGGGSRLERRGRGSVINLVPSDPVSDPGTLPAPPADGVATSPEPMVFLPALQRP